MECDLQLSFRTYQCSPRTPGCVKYDAETLKKPPSSNFISHADKCSHIPQEKKWAVVSAAVDAGAAGGIMIDAGAAGGIVIDAGVTGNTDNSSVGGLEAQ